MTTATEPFPFQHTPDGVSIAVRLKPRARRNRIEGIGRGGAHAAMLRVSVTAAPERGKANAAMVKLLAKEWKMAQRDISIRTGQRSRNKGVFITGEPLVLMARLDAWARGKAGMGS